MPARWPKRADTGAAAPYRKRHFTSCQSKPTLPAFEQLSPHRPPVTRKRRRQSMGAKSAKNWLGVVALLVLSVGAAALPAWGQSISACPSLITTSGTYLVTRNLNSVGTCITIQADNVAIDLQKHKLTGNGTGFGITDGRADKNIVIANGTIEKFSGGIEVNLSYPVTITGMTVQQNLGRGVELHGATVANSKIDNNRGIGIRINGDVLSV